MSRVWPGSNSVAAGGVTDPCHLLHYHLPMAMPNHSFHTRSWHVENLQHVPHSSYRMTGKAQPDGGFATSSWGPCLRLCSGVVQRDMPVRSSIALVATRYSASVTWGGPWHLELTPLVARPWHVATSRLPVFRHVEPKMGPWRCTLPSEISLPNPSSNITMHDAA